MSNKEKLEIWYNDIKKYDKLNIKSVKVLYIRMIDCDDINTKNQLREKIILGTLYLIYNYFKDSFILDTKLDIDDLINVFVVEWIDIIDSGQIMNIAGFKNYIDSFMNRRIYKQYFDKSYIDITHYITNDDLDKIIYWYFYNKLNNNDITYDGYYKYVSSLISKSSKKNNNYIINKLYEALCLEFNNIIDNNLDLKKSDIIKDLRNFRLFLLEKYFSSNINLNNNILDDNIKNVDNEYANKYIYDIVFNGPFLKEREKEILYYKCGFDGINYTLKEVGEMFNISHQRVDQIEKKLKIPRFGSLKKDKVDYYD